MFLHSQIPMISLLRTKAKAHSRNMLTSNPKFKTNTKLETFFTWTTNILRLNCLCQKILYLNWFRMLFLRLLPDIFLVIKYSHYFWASAFRVIKSEKCKGRQGFLALTEIEKKRPRLFLGHYYAKGIFTFCLEFLFPFLWFISLYIYLIFFQNWLF